MKENTGTGLLGGLIGTTNVNISLDNKSIGYTIGGAIIAGTVLILISIGLKKLFNL